MSEATRPHWYLVQARPGQAERAMEQLERQGYCVFHPRISGEQVRRGRPGVVEQALFPDYLFIHLRPGVDNFGPVRSTRGVRQLVSFGKVPVPFDAAFIEILRRQLAAEHTAAQTEQREAATAGASAPDPAVENLLGLADPRERIRALMSCCHNPLMRG